MSNYLIPVIFVTSIIGIATIAFFNSKSTSVYNPNPSALQSEINDSTRNSLVAENYIPKNIFSEEYDEKSGGAKSKKYKKYKKNKKNKSTKRKNK